MILFFVFFVLYFLKGSVLFHEWFFFFVCECVFYLEMLLWQLLKVSSVKLLMRGVCSVGAEWTILDKISWMTWLRSWIEWCLMARFWGYEVWIPSIMAEHLLNLDFQVSDVLRGPVDQLIFHTLEISVPPKKKCFKMMTHSRLSLLEMRKTHDHQWSATIFAQATVNFLLPLFLFSTFFFF